jgi:hypothetical protein
MSILTLVLPFLGLAVVPVLLIVGLLVAATE